MSLDVPALARPDGRVEATVNGASVPSPSATPASSLVAYLVHDVNDAAVERRRRMLVTGGARARLAGFSRGRRNPRADAVVVGRTRDGKLLQRALTVLRALFRPGLLAAVVQDADVLLARNLEMLILAHRLRPLAAPGARIVYECLDIHGSLLGRGPASRALRAIERQLLLRSQLLIVSSPAFVANYFVARQRYEGPVLLVENKVFEVDVEPSLPSPPPPAPPWRIGWYGVLRCEKSLHLLARLVAGSAGGVEVLMRGRPDYDQVPDLDAVVAATPGLSFGGPYDPAELPALYADVHFAWAIDYFEEGQNSAWLLPNRLYESLAHGCVPIAQAATETSAWLRRAGVGLVVASPAVELGPKLAQLEDERYAEWRTKVERAPRAQVVAGAAACRDLVTAVEGGSR